MRSRHETDDSIKARLEAAKESQTRTRVTLVIMSAISLAMLIGSYNAYASFSRERAMSLRSRQFPSATRSTPDILVEQQLRNWADSRNVSIGLLGIKVTIDDAPILGTSALLIFSLWLLLSARRENHTIGFLLRDTYEALRQTPRSETVEFEQAEQRRWLVFQSVVSNTLITNFNHSFARIANLRGPNPTETHAAARIIEWIERGIFMVIGGFFFLFPVLASLVMYILDRYAFNRDNPFRAQDASPPPLGEFFVMSAVVFFAAWIPLLVACLVSLWYSKGTEHVLQQYRHEFGAMEDT